MGAVKVNVTWEFPGAEMVMVGGSGKALQTPPLLDPVPPLELLELLELLLELVELLELLELVVPPELPPPPQALSITAITDARTTALAP